MLQKLPGTLGRVNVNHKLLLSGLGHLFGQPHNESSGVPHVIHDRHTVRNA